MVLVRLNILIIPFLIVSLVLALTVIHILPKLLIHLLHQLFVGSRRVVPLDERVHRGLR